ncbi:MAG: hypothetical protein GYB67_06480 [Chloroflexi bacterium]|nr:hypothetical protein [Chloroflexota bacterium]
MRLMRNRSYIFVLLLSILAACQAAPSQQPVASPAPAFPTMTPGHALRGELPTLLALPLDGSNLANPATAVARANQPTPTPDYADCPSLDGDPPLVARPPGTAREMSIAITAFLSGGGSLAVLENTLRTRWNALGETGGIRGDVDLTGEGVPEIVVSYATPDQGGALVIFGCVNGDYRLNYQGTPGGAIPVILQAGDLNFDGLPELLFTSEDCSADDCLYLTQMVTWSAARGRFINLLSGAISSQTIPTVADVDNDRVSELRVELNNPGDADTGPLRTGTTLYDWNGLIYTRSVTELDPPRFRVQVLHQADRAFAAENFNEAIALYNFGLDDPALEPWRADEPEILRTYMRYRLLLAYAFTEDQRLVTDFQTILRDYPDPLNAPVYVEMSTVFWNALQVTNNLNAACTEVRSVIARRPEALTLLNRYGSRSPVYTAADLCPF